MAAIITYRPNSQKIQGQFRDLLTKEILKDICFLITGQTSYKVVELNDTYNRGRLLWVEYKGYRNYVSLSESRIEGRNSSLQSVPTAINLYYADTYRKKRLYYYFLPFVGNPFTDYHLFYYRLLSTSGVEFLNIRRYLNTDISPYKTVDEIIQDRNENRTNNQTNNSSFVSKTKDRIQLYAKNIRCK